MANGQGRTLRDRMALWSPPQPSVNALKVMGAVFMALYYFSASVVNRGILDVSRYTTQELDRLLASSPQAMLWAGIGSVCSAVGIMGVPIFAYLLVQGVEHTHNPGRYALTVLVFAAVSEIPYDLAMSGKPWDPSGQNSLWTVFIALLMLLLMQRFQGKGAGPLVLGISFAAAGCLWAILLRSRFGGGFVLICAILYLLRERKGVSLALGALASLIFATAILGFVPVALCSGHRRDIGRKKYVYYALYPVMLAVFALLCTVLKG